MEEQRKKRIYWGLKRMKELLDGLGLSALGLYFMLAFDSNKHP